MIILITYVEIIIKHSKTGLNDYKFSSTMTKTLKTYIELFEHFPAIACCKNVPISSQASLTSLCGFHNCDCSWNIRENKKKANNKKKKSLKKRGFPFLTCDIFSTCNSL